MKKLKAIIMVCLICFCLGMTACFASDESNVTEAATEPTITETISVPTIEVTEAATEATEVIEDTEPVETTTATEVTEPAVDVTEATTAEEDIPDVGMSDLEMLACVIYQEAGADYFCDDCRRRVADVVLNRVAHEDFPDTIYEVLTQRSQYGRYHWTGIVWPKRASSEYEAHAVARAYRIAEEVLGGQHSELYGNGYVWQAEFKQGSDIVYHCDTYFGR